MAAAEGNVITVEEAAGLNQALVLQCSLVTLKDSAATILKRVIPCKFTKREKTIHRVQFSLNWPLGRFSLVVVMSVCVYVCMYVCHTPEMTLPNALETSGRRAYR